MVLWFSARALSQVYTRYWRGASFQPRASIFQKVQCASVQYAGVPVCTAVVHATVVLQSTVEMQCAVICYGAGADPTEGFRSVRPLLIPVSLAIVYVAAAFAAVR